MIGQRVKELRNAANLTQQELAEGIISRTYLSLIEKNSVHPSTNVLKKLSERLNCTLDDFTTTSSDRNLSLLDIKKEIKWAENHALINDFSKMKEFLDKHYENLDSITEYERGAIHWVRASYFFNQNNYDRTRKELDITIGIVHKMKDVTLHLRSLELYGRVEYEMGELMLAIDYLTRANNITIIENITNTSRISVLGYLAEFYRLIGENYVAINLCSDALSLSRRLSTHHFGLQLENTISKAYMTVRDFENAEYHMKRALKFAELEGPGLANVGILMNMSLLMMDQERYADSYNYITAAVKMIDDNKLDFPFSQNVRLRYGQILAKIGSFDEAKAIVQPEVEKDRNGFAAEILGDIYVDEGNYLGALQYYLDALEADDIPLYMAKIYPKVSRIYRELGMTEKAIEYYEKSIHEFEGLLVDML